MAKINQIRRLAIIVSKLNSKHYVPAEELVDYVSYTIRARYSDTAGCTLRTLQRDFRTIEELFGVTIRHDKLCGYYIDERYGSAEDYEALLLNLNCSMQSIQTALFKISTPGTSSGDYSAEYR